VNPWPRFGLWGLRAAHHSPRPCCLEAPLHPLQSFGPPHRRTNRTTLHLQGISRSVGAKAPILLATVPMYTVLWMLAREVGAACLVLPLLLEAGRHCLQTWPDRSPALLGARADLLQLLI
jgi:hypothetical protein